MVHADCQSVPQNLYNTLAVLLSTHSIGSMTDVTMWQEVATE